MRPTLDDKQSLYKLDELNCAKIAFFFKFINKVRYPQFISDQLLRKIISLENGIFFSYTLRQLLSRKYNITLGSYSYGNLDDLFRFPTKTIIGRYTSIGPGVRIFQANHPINFISTHPFFYRIKIGIVEKEAIQRYELVIGHDVWIGANTIICPSCHKIGNGAVIGAGSVITKDVPDYAIIGGNPARIIKMRFKEALIVKLLDSCWWEYPFEMIKLCSSEMTQPLHERCLEDFLDKVSSFKTHSHYSTHST